MIITSLILTLKELLILNTKVENFINRSDEYEKGISN